MLARTEIKSDVKKLSIDFFDIRLKSLENVAYAFNLESHAVGGANKIVALAVVGHLNAIWGHGPNRSTIDKPRLYLHCITIQSLRSP